MISGKHNESFNDSCCTLFKGRLGQEQMSCISHVMPSLDEKPNKAKNYCTSSRRDRDRDRGHTIRECNTYGNTGVDERQKQ
jgi:hypothetical protein